jgi:hypothetical protein
MKKRIFTFFIATAFILNAAGFAAADTRSGKKQVNPLLALLPASDIVVSMDAKRFYNSALPQILSGNKSLLDGINAQMDEFKTATGIDPRQFEQVAVGATVKPGSAEDMDLEPVSLARGNFNANSLAALAKYASNNNYREEKIGIRTIYIFSPKALIEKHKAIIKDPSILKVFDDLLPRYSDEIAVTAYDANTLAFGTFERLKLLLNDSAPRVDAALLLAVNRNPNAVMSFAAKFPNGISDFIKLGDDELGRNLNSIRQIAGTIDFTGENILISAAAKTTDAARAEALHQNFSDLLAAGKYFLSGSKNPKNKTYVRMLEGAKVTRSGNEVLLNLLIAQSDVNLLIGAK